MTDYTPGTDGDGNPLDLDVERKQLAERLDELDAVQAKRDAARSAALARLLMVDLFEPSGTLKSRGSTERGRQIEEEGYEPIRDVGRSGELALAAGCYATAAKMLAEGDSIAMLEQFPPEGWPWEERFWKPVANVKRMREKAYALLLAAQDALLLEDAEPGEAVRP